MSMSDATLGIDVDMVRGASVQSWRAANPRELLKSMIEANRGSDRIAIFKLFRERLQEDESEPFLDTIIEYWFANNYHSLMSSPALRNHADAENIRARKSALVSQFTTSIKERIVEAAALVLSDMMMPNGKRLAECTGAECSKMGGWLRNVSKRVEGEQTVGAVLSECDLQRLYSNTN